MKINSDDFIKLLEKEFEFIEPGTLKITTDYKTLAEWGSMQALILMALIVTEFNVVIPGAELLKCSTVGDLISLIESKF